MPDLNPFYYQTWFEYEKSPIPKAFAIITAHNPKGAEIDAEENETLDHRLCAQLDEMGIAYFPIAAGSEKRDHVEASYGIVTDMTTAMSLCNQFDQDAIFWVEAGKLFIIDRHQTIRDYVAEWEERTVG